MGRSGGSRAWGVHETFIDSTAQQTEGTGTDRLAGRYRPSKVGFCLATNEDTAARWSSEPPVLAIISLSNARESSSELLAANVTDRFTAEYASVGP